MAPIRQLISSVALHQLQRFPRHTNEDGDSLADDTSVAESTAPMPKPLNSMVSFLQTVQRYRVPMKFVPTKITQTKQIFCSAQFLPARVRLLDKSTLEFSSIDTSTALQFWSTYLCGAKVGMRAVLPFTCVAWEHFLWNLTVPAQAQPNTMNLQKDYQTFCQIFAQCSLSTQFAQLQPIIPRLLLDEATFLGKERQQRKEIVEQFLKYLKSEYNMAYQSYRVIEPISIGKRTKEQLALAQLLVSETSCLKTAIGTLEGFLTSQSHSMQPDYNLYASTGFFNPWQSAFAPRVMAGADAPVHQPQPSAAFASDKQARNSDAIDSTRNHSSSKTVTSHVSISQLPMQPTALATPAAPAAPATPAAPAAPVAPAAPASLQPVVYEVSDWCFIFKAQWDNNLRSWSMFLTVFGTATQVSPRHRPTQPNYEFPDAITDIQDCVAHLGSTTIHFNSPRNDAKLVQRNSDFPKLATAFKQHHIAPQNWKEILQKQSDLLNELIELEKHASVIEFDGEVCQLTVPPEYKNKTFNNVSNEVRHLSQSIVNQLRDSNADHVLENGVWDQITEQHYPHQLKHWVSRLKKMPDKDSAGNEVFSYNNLMAFCAEFPRLVHWAKTFDYGDVMSDTNCCLRTYNQYVDVYGVPMALYGFWDWVKDSDQLKRQTKHYAPTSTIAIRRDIFLKQLKNLPDFCVDKLITVATMQYEQVTHQHFSAKPNMLLRKFVEDILSGKSEGQYGIDIFVNSFFEEIMFGANFDQSFAVATENYSRFLNIMTHTRGTVFKSGSIQGYVGTCGPSDGKPLEELDMLASLKTLQQARKYVDRAKRAFPSSSASCVTVQTNTGAHEDQDGQQGINFGMQSFMRGSDGIPGMSHWWFTPRHYSEQFIAALKTETTLNLDRYSVFISLATLKSIVRKHNIPIIFVAQGEGCVVPVPPNTVHGVINIGGAFYKMAFSTCYGYHLPRIAQALGKYRRESHTEVYRTTLAVYHFLLALSKGDETSSEIINTMLRVHGPALTVHSLKQCIKFVLDELRLESGIFPESMRARSFLRPLVKTGPKNTTC